MLLNRSCAARRSATALLALGALAGTPHPRIAAAHPRAQTEGHGLHIEHAPPACLLEEKASRVVACLVPRSHRASLRVFFRADGAPAWYSVPLRSDIPCYSGLLPRPSRATARVVYFIEAEGQGGEKARTGEQEVVVVADPATCPGRVAPAAPGQRAAWDSPAGAPRVPPGFEGTAPPAAPTAVVPTPAAPPAPSVKGPPTGPSSPRALPRPETPPAADAPKGGGHGLRTASLVTVGVAAAGGAAVAATRKDESTAASPPAGSGLPATGVSGVYVGSETLNYAAGCAGTDDVVLSLQEAGGALSGVLTFTVRTCPCCASGHGANAVVGSLSGTSVQLATPIGFSYSGAFAGNRLSGALAGPGGVTGSWSVDKH